MATATLLCCMELAPLAVALQLVAADLCYMQECMSMMTKNHTWQAYGVVVICECSNDGRHAFVMSRIAKPLAAVKVKGLMRFDLYPGKTLQAHECMKMLLSLNCRSARCVVLSG